jgi:hypothetical protein
MHREQRVGPAAELNAPRRREAGAGGAAVGELAPLFPKPS